MTDPSFADPAVAALGVEGRGGQGQEAGGGPGE